MTADPKLKTLIKILIGTAWLDGQIQLEEREYLHRVVKEKGMADEPDIQPLLYEFRPVKPEECYGWVKEFLGNQPTTESCQQLIEAISGLIYSDGTVANEEARLLTNLQLLDPSHESKEPKESTILKAVRDLYRRWVSSLDS